MTTARSTVPTRLRELLTLGRHALIAQLAFPNATTCGFTTPPRSSRRPVLLLADEAAALFSTCPATRRGHP